MKRKRSLEKQEAEKGPNDPAMQSAEEAAKAKEEEIRAALLSKSEQGQSTLASIPAYEDKKSRKRSN